MGAMAWILPDSMGDTDSKTIDLNQIRQAIECVQRCILLGIAPGFAYHACAEAAVLLILLMVVCCKCCRDCCCCGPTEKAYYIQMIVYAGMMIAEFILNSVLNSFPTRWGC